MTPPEGGRPSPDPKIRTMGRTPAEDIDPHIHVDEDSPLYNGFRMREMWTFSTIDPVDNQEGLISFQGPDGHMPLVCSDRRRVEDLRPIATLIARTIGQQVLVKHYILTEGSEVIEP